MKAKKTGRPKQAATRVVSIRVPSPLYEAALKKIKAIKLKLLKP